MKYITDLLGAFVFLLLWIAGMVIANGFFSTLFAIFLPPWGWYLLAERALMAAGWI